MKKKFKERPLTKGEASLATSGLLALEKSSGYEKNCNALEEQGVPWL